MPVIHAISRDRKTLPSSGRSTGDLCVTLGRNSAFARWPAMYSEDMNCGDCLNPGLGQSLITVIQGLGAKLLTAGQETGPFVRNLERVSSGRDKS